MMNPNGYGLGLSICKNICDSLEGEIKVTSTLRKGAKFTFSMRAYFYQNATDTAEEVENRYQTYLDYLLQHSKDANSAHSSELDSVSGGAPEETSPRPPNLITPHTYPIEHDLAQGSDLTPSDAPTPVQNGETSSFRMSEGSFGNI
jgi:hypothetical protein